MCVCRLKALTSEWTPANHTTPSGSRIYLMSRTKFFSGFLKVVRNFLYTLITHYTLPLTTHSEIQGMSSNLLRRYFIVYVALQKLKTFVSVP